MQKRVFSNELAYVLGLIIMGLGNACMERADFGMAMVVTPAYILHLKISQTLPWFTFGVSEYLLQGVVLLSLILVMKRFKLSYLYSFLTAVLYGYTLDAAMLLVRLLPGHAFVHRLVFYAVGALLCAMGVSLLFHTSLPRPTSCSSRRSPANWAWISTASRRCTTVFSAPSASF